MDWEEWGSRNLPQVAENNTPQGMDAVTGCFVYNESINQLSMVKNPEQRIPAKENFVASNPNPSVLDMNE
jgi:hypothetical protein